jgi:uncharacterized membrane protein
MLTKLTVSIIQQVGWQWCYVSCGALGIAAGLLGLVVIKEPPNSVVNNALRAELVTLKGKTVHRKKENLVAKILKSYVHGFREIFGSLAASLCLLGIFCRQFETSVSGTLMTKAFEVYTTKAAKYTDLYSTLSAAAILTGSFTSNFFSIFLISLLGEEDPMTIPYVCIARHVVDIPALVMMFVVQNDFYVSIAGFFIQQVLAKGWTAPALLMLRGVVPPEVASLSIGIFLLVVSVDYSISIEVIQEVVTAYNFDLACCNGSYGDLVFWFCAIPAGLAIPLFYFAGRTSQGLQEQKVDRGQMTENELKKKTVKQTLFIRNYGGLNIDNGGVNLPELGKAHFNLWHRMEDKER